MTAIKTDMNKAQNNLNDLQHHMYVCQLHLALTISDGYTFL